MPLVEVFQSLNQESIQNNLIVLTSVACLIKGQNISTDYILEERSSTAKRGILSANVTMSEVRRISEENELQNAAYSVVTW